MGGLFAAAVVAFLFGLVNGLGFAGALKDRGLPQNHLSVALLTFTAFGRRGHPYWSFGRISSILA